MPSRQFYLQQAKAYFDMATMSRDEAARSRWIERANECLILADALGDDVPTPDMMPTGSTQPQPQGQQQQTAAAAGKAQRRQGRAALGERQFPSTQGGHTATAFHSTNSWAPWAQIRLRRRNAMLRVVRGIPIRGPVTLIGKSRERLIDPQHLDPPPCMETLRHIDVLRRIVVHRDRGAVDCFLSSASQNTDRPVVCFAGSLFSKNWLVSPSARG